MKTSLLKSFTFSCHTLPNFSGGKLWRIVAESIFAEKVVTLAALHSNQPG